MRLHLLVECKFFKNDYSNDLELIELLKKPVKYFQVNDYKNDDIVYEIDADKLSINKESEIFINRQNTRENYQNDETLIYLSLKINDLKKIHSLFGDSIDFLLKIFSDIILEVSIYERYNLNFEKVLLYNLNIDLKPNLTKFNTYSYLNPKLYKIENLDRALSIKLNTDKIIHLNENHYFIDYNPQKIKGSNIDGLVYCTYHKFTFDLLMTIKFYKYLPKIFLITKNEDFGINYSSFSNESEIYNNLNINTYNELINILSDDHWYRKQLQKQKQKFDHRKTIYGNFVSELGGFTIEEKLTISLNYYFYNLLKNNGYLEFLSNIIFKIISINDCYEIKIIIGGAEYALNDNNKVNQEIIFILNLLLFQITYLKVNVQNIFYIDETVFNFKSAYVEGIKIELDKISTLKNLFVIANTNNSHFIDLEKDNYLINSNNISLFRNTLDKNLLHKVNKQVSDIILVDNTFFYNTLLKIRYLNRNFNCLLIDVSNDLLSFYLKYFKNSNNNIQFVKIDFKDSSVHIQNILNPEDDGKYIDIMDLVPRDLLKKTYEELYGHQNLLSQVPNYVQISTFVKYWKIFSDNYNKKGSSTIVRNNCIELDMFYERNSDEFSNLGNHKYLNKIFYIKERIPLLIENELNSDKIHDIYDFKYNLKKYQENFNVNLVNDFNALFKINLIFEKEDRFPSRFNYNNKFMPISEEFNYEIFAINLLKNLSDNPLTKMTTEMTELIKKLKV